MKLFLGYDFINWNEYINIERSNKYKANKIKQYEKRIVGYLATEKYKGKYPISIKFKPHFKDKRRDLDNYRLKGLIDGLVTAKVIKNDNLNCIQKIEIEPVFDDKTGVEIEIKEI